MKLALLLLRIGIAFALFYAAIAGFIDPQSWIGFFPSWVRGFVSDQVLMTSWGVVEVVLGALVLFLKRAYYPALAAAALFLGIVLFNWGARDIVFRDISLFFAALSLALFTKRL